MEEDKVQLLNFQGVSKFKSVGRAIRRGNMTETGIIVPHRPYNNKANTCKRRGHHSRSLNELKKEIYAKLRETNYGGV